MLLEPIKNNRLIDLISSNKSLQILYFEKDRAAVAAYKKESNLLIFSSPFPDSAISQVIKEIKISNDMTLEVPIINLPALSVILHGLEYEKSQINIMLRTFKSKSEYPGDLKSSQISVKKSSIVPSTFLFERLNEASSSSIKLVREFSEKVLNKPLDESKAEAILLSSNKEFFGLFNGERLVSIVALTREINRFRCVSYFYTTPELRCQGLGIVLLKELLKNSEKRYQGLFLHVESNNAIAESLYRKLNFLTIASFTRLEIKKKVN